MRLRAPRPLPTTLDGLGLRMGVVVEGTSGGGPFYKRGCEGRALGESKFTWG